MKKVELKESGVSYRYIGKKEELKIIVIGDASFKTDEKAIGGIILLLAHKDLTKACPIHWKSKGIERVCQSSKEVEILILNKLV